MKKVLAIFVLVAVFVMVSLVSADTNTLPGSAWESGQQIQNVGADAAGIVLTAYNATGASFACDPTTPNPLPAGASFTWLPDQCDTPAGFQGSAVASSDQPIVAVVNVNNRSAGAAAGQYQGTDGSDVSTTLAFPLVKNDHASRTTTFYVQNASDGTNDITATFNELDGTPHVLNFNAVPANAMVVVNPSDAGFPTGTGTGLGSLVVAGTAPMAGASLEHETTATVGANLQASRAFVPSDYDTEVNCPLARYQFPSTTNINASTGIQAQNVGVAAADISVTYSVIFPAPRTVGPVTATGVAAGASANFLQSDHLASGEIAAATVTSSEPMAVIVNDRADAFTPRRFTTYACFGTSNATNTIALPLVKDQFVNNTHGLQVANVGNAATQITLNFVNFNGDAIDVQTTVNVPAGASKTFFRMATGGTSDITAINGTSLADLLDGPFGAGAGGIAGVTITADQPIVAIANESNYNGVNAQDTKNYEGFNR